MKNFQEKYSIFLRIYSKEQIYNKLKTYKDSPWYSKAVLYFLIHSDINFNDIKTKIIDGKKNYMINFIAKFLKTYYVGNNIQNKVMIEHIFAYKLGMKDNEVNESVLNVFI